MTFSTPARARSCPSSSPDGPAPTIATCVRIPPPFEWPARVWRPRPRGVNRDHNIAVVYSFDAFRAAIGGDWYRDDALLGDLVALYAGSDATERSGLARF